MRWVSRKKGSVRTSEGEQRGSFLTLLTAHRRRVIDCRVIAGIVCWIKTSPSCYPLELFLRSIDLLTLSHL